MLLEVVSHHDVVLDRLAHPISADRSLQLIELLTLRCCGHLAFVDSIRSLAELTNGDCHS